MSKSGVVGKKVGCVEWSKKLVLTVFEAMVGGVSSKKWGVVYVH